MRLLGVDPFIATRLNGFPWDESAEFELDRRNSFLIECVAERFGGFATKSEDSGLNFPGEVEAILPDEGGGVAAVFMIRGFAGVLVEGSKLPTTSWPS